MLRCWRPKPTAQLRKLEDDLVKKGVTDQADGLRRLMGRSAARWVTVLGSAPAVGASSITLNLAAALRQQGQQVLLLDEHSRPQAIPERSAGQLVLIDALLDADGGLSPLAEQADNILLVLRPGAASITASYACIKRLHYACPSQRMRLLVNHAADATEAQRILATLAATASRYLALTLESAGCVRADPLLAQAQRLNLTVVEAFAASAAALDLRQLAADLLHWPRPASAAVSVAAGHPDQPLLALH